MTVEERLQQLEGRMTAMELICPMFTAYLTSKAIRSLLIPSLEEIAAGYDFPVDAPRSFVEGFSGCFDEVASQLRKAP